MTVRRFAFIDEVEARGIEPGSVIELERSGRITPLALDTLRERRITVVAAGDGDPMLPPDLAPVSPVVRIALGSDKNGAAIAAALVSHLRGLGKAVTPHVRDSARADDYVDLTSAVARAVARGEADAGIVIAANGIAAAVAANKIRGVRAAMCSSAGFARAAREGAGANVLALSATAVTVAEAIEITDTWIQAGTTDAGSLLGLLKVRRLEEKF